MSIPVTQLLVSVCLSKVGRLAHDELPELVDIASLASFEKTNHAKLSHALTVKELFEIHLFADLVLCFHQHVLEALRLLLLFLKAEAISQKSNNYEVSGLQKLHGSDI